jgi:hypothetical protein
VGEAAEKPFSARPHAIISQMAGLVIAAFALTSVAEMILEEYPCRRTRKSMSMPTPAP